MAAINLLYPTMKVFQLLSTQVAAGAKIYTYEAGTSTDKTTYSDQALTTPNSNPVIADSNGEAQVWGADDGLYKIVINDSDDVLINSVDDVGSTGTATAVDGAYNKLVNGSWEDNTGDNGVPASWDLSITGASSIDIDTSDQLHGLASLQFVGGAGGAGTATSGFFEVQASKEIAIRFALKASLATVGNTVKFLWYTSAQIAASTSSTTVYNVTTTAPTSWTPVVKTATPGSDVKYGKIEISGATTAGTTNYDDLVVFDIESELPVKGDDITSATELLVDIAGDYHDVTGTTAITSFAAVRIGTIKKLHFDGVLTLTYHATNLVLPSGVSITTEAGDEAEFIEYATGDWRCIKYTTADGLSILTPPGTWEVVGTPASISNDTEVDFTGIDDTYDTYMVIFENIVPTAGSFLYTRIGTGATPTWQTGTVYRQGAGATSSIPLNSTTVQPTTTEDALSGIFYLFSPSNTTTYTKMAARVMYSNVGTIYDQSKSGVYEATTAVTALRFYMSTGNLSTGTITLYGLKK